MDNKNEKYDIWHIANGLLVAITAKCIVIDELEFEEEKPKKTYCVPISCLEYGLEANYKVGEKIEFYPCEWWLMQNNLI